MVRDLLKKYVEKALEGDRLSIGRLLTFLERDPKEAGKILDMLPQRDGYHVIGITGITGSGKSTLLSQLLNQYAGSGFKCAVVAIDPSSVLSKGALLGDRIRMQVHATNPNIFIRSVSTRGLKGGLSFAGVSMVEVFGRIGFDKIFVESIGVGQADVDIMSIADTITVVTVPGLGDDIQALKAGVMEIGDIYVINKVDKNMDEANKTYEYLKFAIESGDIGVRKGWTPKIIKTSAVLGQGIDNLVSALEEHFKYITDSSQYTRKKRFRKVVLARLLAEKMLLDKMDEIDLEGLEGDVYNMSLKIINEVFKRVEDLR